jgi:hypothetical protein
MRLRRKLLVFTIFLVIGVGMVYTGYLGMNDFYLWWSGISLALLFFGLLVTAFGLGYLIHKPIGYSGEMYGKRDLNDPGKARRAAYESKERAYHMSMTGPYFRGPPGDGGPADSIFKKER